MSPLSLLSFFGSKTKLTLSIVWGWVLETERGTAFNSRRLTSLRRRFTSSRSRRTTTVSSLRYLRWIRSSFELRSIFKDGPSKLSRQTRLRSPFSSSRIRRVGRAKLRFLRRWRTVSSLFRVISLRSACENEADLRPFVLSQPSLESESSRSAQEDLLS